MIESLDITRTTYRVADFLSWQRSGNLRLRPPFQRNSVWSGKAKSFFVDSLVRGFPVPLIFIQDKTDPKTYEPERLVVDGQQRLRTILSFVDRRCLKDHQVSDAFAVLRIHNPELAGMSFEHLPKEIRDRILGFQFSVHVLPSTTPNAALLEIFARMNATGTKLNDQELRNARFAGAFKQVAYDLAYSQLENWLRWRVFREAQLARMLEVEQVSELLMFLLDGMRAKSQAAINATYRRHEDSFPQDKASRKRFSHVFDVLEAVFGRAGEDSDKRDDIRPFRNQSWFYTIFAFVHDQCFGNYIGSRKTSTKPIRIDKGRLVTHLAKRAASLTSVVSLK